MLFQSDFFPGYDGTLLTVQVVLLIGAAGRVLGLDSFLHRKWPRLPFC